MPDPSYWSGQRLVGNRAMRPLKIFCSIACLLILASNVWSMSRLSEGRFFYARSPPATLIATAGGCLAIYGMINPTKASYSMAPTMVVCALAGFLTARLFLAEQRRHRLLLTGLIGLSIGLAVNFRLPNLFLSSGYFLFFFAFFLLSRKIEAALQGMVFGAAFLAGMAPTLVANAINAGSPFSTTYGGADVTPPDFSFSVIGSYLADMQFVLLVLAMAWTALILS